MVQPNPRVHFHAAPYVGIESAAAAFTRAIRLGYQVDEINVLMQEKVCRAFFALPMIGLRVPCVDGKGATWMTDAPRIVAAIGAAISGQKTSALLQQSRLFVIGPIASAFLEKGGPPRSFAEALGDFSVPAAEAADYLALMSKGAVLIGVFSSETKAAKNQLKRSEVSIDFAEPSFHRVRFKF